MVHLSQTDLKSLDKYAAFQNLSIYDTWKNIRKQYKNKIKNKMKIIAVTRKDMFESPDDSYSVLELKSSETMNLFNSTKKINRQA